MALTVTVEPAASLAGEVTAIGLPAAAAEGDEGPVLLAGRKTLAGRELPDQLDAAWCERQGFKAKPGQVATLESSLGAPKLVIVGVGAREAIAPERWRRAAAAERLRSQRRPPAVAIDPRRVPRTWLIVCGVSHRSGAAYYQERGGLFVYQARMPVYRYVRNVARQAGCSRHRLEIRAIVDRWLDRQTRTAVRP